MAEAMWETGREELEEECRFLEEENRSLGIQIETAPEKEQAALRDRLARNRALLSGKEICLQHMELAQLMKEREMDKEKEKDLQFRVRR